MAFPSQIDNFGSWKRETITIQSYCNDSNYNGYNDGRVRRIFRLGLPDFPE